MLATPAVAAYSSKYAAAGQFISGGVADHRPDSEHAEGVDVVKTVLNRLMARTGDQPRMDEILGNPKPKQIEDEPKNYQNPISTEKRAAVLRRLRGM